MNTGTVLPLLLAYRYWILFPLSAFEGPIVTLVSGWLISHGTFAIVPTVMILLLGDIIPDALYYWFGRMSRKTNFLARYGHRFGISEERLTAIEYLWHRHTFKSAVFSKWAYGMSTPLLISAGLARLPFRKFLAASVSLASFQCALLLTVGYYFGSSYQVIAAYIDNAKWLIAGGVILFLLLYFGIARYAKRAFFRNT